MWHKVKDLSADQRLAIESLLGRRLRDDEGLNIQPSRVLSEAPEGEERTAAYRQYLDHLDSVAGRSEDVPEEALDSAIDEACRRVRHRALDRFRLRSLALNGTGPCGRSSSRFTVPDWPD
jgi:hypothetical protein